MNRISTKETKVERRRQRDAVAMAVLPGIYQNYKGAMNDSIDACAILSFEVANAWLVERDRINAKEDKKRGAKRARRW